MTKAGGGFSFNELLTPHDHYKVRVHKGRCYSSARQQGYKPLSYGSGQG